MPVIAPWPPPSAPGSESGTTSAAASSASSAPSTSPATSERPAARIPTQPTRGRAADAQTGEAQSAVTHASVTALPQAGARQGADARHGADVRQGADVGPGVADTAMAVGTTVDHLTETYRAHYRSLLGLAALLLDDTASCEDVVQEAFIRVHSARNRVRDPEKTLAYLRQTVVNLSRSALRRRILGLKLLSKPMPDMASAEEGAYEQLERDQLIKAMRGLQRRQREVLVLRYFADMTEAQVAEVLGLSLGSVKAYGSRGIAALRVAMEAPA
ncbi:ECF subfamily RNA polymerase sigma-24 subunit [Streptomyces mobaraensis NBRC 13819 = DSM 40847]|uniref:ECF subfamily RNA polymerase sigma-24 subunit n=1 Tax=Streptomyces mobaraensis (strain ATCC 29032 / DSM 40847 / JCM 4168 / NBRC 13819 / NCIMB 11159 / IPCR 16-22) TaxID=1223523 RepID=M3CCV2_STRM1|nr:ECF subfamily RNA polymerase sigma-24 subunit [Streptomyces mobaraensis NBRC 13819 = DSM 40847]